MKMLSFKFQQNRTINEEFDFFERGGVRGTPIYYIGILYTFIITTHIILACRIKCKNRIIYT